MSQVIRLSAGGIVPPGTYVQTLTGDSGGPVGPDGVGNINIKADNAGLNCGSTVVVVGTPIDNTLTLNVTDVNNNTLIGANAGNLTLTGTSNTGLGDAVLSSLTTGAQNTAVGADTLTTITGAGQNSVFGYRAGRLLTAAGNTAVGWSALAAATNTINNVAVGNQSLVSYTLPGDGSGNNVALGSGTLAALLTGKNNVSVGTPGASGSFLGYLGAESNNIIISNNGVTGDNGVIRIGTPTTQTTCYVAGINGNTVSSPLMVTINSATSQLGTAAIPTGTVSTLTGDVGGAISPTAGNFNVLTGLLTNNAGATLYFDGTGSTLSLVSSDTVKANTFIGASAGNVTLTGANNTGLGINTLFSLNTGNFNTAVGFSAGQQNAIGNSNTYIGCLAGSVATSSHNTAVGYEASRLMVGGANNTSLGSTALRANITGSNNVAIGYESLVLATNTGNTSVGTQAGSATTTGSANTFVGFQAGLGNTTGNSNIFIGNLAGQNITSSGSNICIGNTGVLADSGVIRIGTNGIHTTAYLAGINGNTVSNAQLVTINSSTSQLGVTPLSPSSLFPWQEITTSQTAAVNNGYFINSVGSMNLALPTTSAVGDAIEAVVVSNGSTLNITQAAGQQIFIGNTNTTLGAGGSLQSTSIGDAIKLVCRTANTVWYVTSTMGNWSIV